MNFSRKTRSRGQALVEFSFLAIFLLFLALGIMQYAVILNTSSSLQQISREGGRYMAQNAAKNYNSALSASTNQTNEQAALATAMGYICATTPIKPSDLSATCSAPSSNYAAGNQVTVTITYNMKKKIFVSTGFPGMGQYNNPVSLSCTMNIEPTS